MGRFSRFFAAFIILSGSFLSAHADDSSVGALTDKAILDAHQRPENQRFPWSALQERIEQFFNQSSSGSGGDPLVEQKGGPSTEGPEIQETDTRVTIKICGLPNPINGGTTCAIIVIDKQTGNVTVVFEDFVGPLDFKYYIRCLPDGTCEIFDDLLPPFRTRFCTIKRGDDGAVTYTCNFKYFGFKVSSTFKLYIENGQVCIKIDDRAPSCVPLGDLPEWQLRFWQEIKPMWLPLLPIAPDVGPPAPWEQLKLLELF